MHAQYKTHPTLERIRELLDYDPKTGNLIWRINRGNVKAGGIAGSTNPKGYLMVGIDGTQYRCHRIVWALHNDGELPKRQIDHIDRNKTNNRIENLRDVPCVANINNRGTTSKTGFRGVYPRGDRYCATINVRGRRHFIGLYDDAEEAFDAFKAAHIEHHGIDSEFFSAL